MNKDRLDIYDFGFDLNLNREITKVESPLIYNIIDDRLSLLIQNNNKITPIMSTKLIYAPSNNTTG